MAMSGPKGGLEFEIERSPFIPKFGAEGQERVLRLYIK